MIRGYRQLEDRVAPATTESRRSFLQKGPDDEPESWAGGKAEYGGRQAEGGGIVSILEMIREDVENEMKIARKEEGEAMAMCARAEGTGTHKAMKGSTGMGTPFRLRHESLRALDSRNERYC